MALRSAGFSLVTCDFGVGISQFTQLRGQNVTETIAWNWKENMRHGVNVLLGKTCGVLRAAQAGKKPKVRPNNLDRMGHAGWQGYNASKSYADGRRNSVEAGRLRKAQVPSVLTSRSNSSLGFHCTRKEDIEAWPR